MTPFERWCQENNFVLVTPFERWCQENNFVLVTPFERWCQENNFVLVTPAANGLFYCQSCGVGAAFANQVQHTETCVTKTIAEIVHTYEGVEHADTLSLSRARGAQSLPGKDL